MKVLKSKKTPLILKHGLYLKREDQQPSGSVKDRGMIAQLTHLPPGRREVVISSSGNAGISLAYWGRRLGLTAHIFVSPKLPSEKKERLQKLGAKIHISPRALSESIRFARRYHFPHLRQSISVWARNGFRSLGEELRDESAPEAIFFPVSSGTTMLGVSEAWADSKKKPVFVLVQTAGHCPLARHLVPCPPREKNTLATALVAKYIPCQKEILTLVKSYGQAVVVRNAEIGAAWQWLRQEGIVTSFEGAAAVAAAWQIKATRRWQRPVCLLTGKYYG